MRKLLHISFALILIFCTALNAFAVTTDGEDMSEGAILSNGNSARYVISDEAGLLHDYIHLLSDEAKTFTEKYSDFFLSILTTDDTKGRSSQEYTDDYIDYYIDKAYGDNILIFLIDMDNREVYIATAGLAISVFSDYAIENMIDVIYAYLLGGDYYNVFSRLIVEAAVYIDEYYYYDDYGYDDYGIISEYDDDYYYNSDDYPNFTSTTDDSNVLITIGGSLLASLIIGALIIFLIVRRYKTVGKTGGLPYNMVTNLDLHVIKDSYSRRSVTTRHIPPPPSNNNNHSSGGGHSGGGHSGGGSSHTTSGGHSAGGGGRGF